MIGLVIHFRLCLQIIYIAMSRGERMSLRYVITSKYGLEEMKKKIKGK